MTTDKQRIAKETAKEFLIAKGYSVSQLDGYDHWSDPTSCLEIEVLDLLVEFAAHSEQGWVSVSEKLPGAIQVDVFVKWTLVGVSTEPYYRRITDVRYEDGEWLYGSSNWERIEEQVTHWRPLPAPPVQPESAQEVK